MWALRALFGQPAADADITAQFGAMRTKVRIAKLLHANEASEDLRQCLEQYKIVRLLTRSQRWIRMCIIYRLKHRTKHVLKNKQSSYLLRNQILQWGLKINQKNYIKYQSNRAKYDLKTFFYYNNSYLLKLYTERKLQEKYNLTFSPECQKWHELMTVLICLQSSIEIL